MAAKPPRIYRMAVVPQRPVRRAVLLAVLAGLFIVAMVAGYLAGRYLTLRDMAADIGGTGDGTVRLADLVDENAALRDELAAYRGGGDVAREVEAQVRTENLGLHEHIDELEKAVAWYRRVALPDRSGQGLSIEQITVAGGHLQFALVRTGDTDGAVEGRLEGRVLAQGSSGRLELPLAQVLAAEALPFRVRYVEERSPELRLPAGLVPLRVDLVAVLAAPHGGRVEKSWQRQANNKSQE